MDSTPWWVWLVLAIILVVSQAFLLVRVWHRITEIFAEARVLAGRLGQLGDVLGELDLSPLDGDTHDHALGGAVAGEAAISPRRPRGR